MSPNAQSEMSVEPRSPIEHDEDCEGVFASDDVRFYGNDYALILCGCRVELRSMEMDGCGICDHPELDVDVGELPVVHTHQVTVPANGAGH